MIFGDSWGNLWREGWKSWDGERSRPIGAIWCGSPEVWTVRWEIARQVSGGDIWLGLSPLELQFLPMGMFWMRLESKWPLFFAFCSTTSCDTIEAPCCRTRVENCIALLGGCSIYIVDVFGGGIFHEKNFLGVSYIWPLTMLCLSRSRDAGEMLAFDWIRNLGISRSPLGEEQGSQEEIGWGEEDWILHATWWNEKFQFYHALWLNQNLWRVVSSK